MLKQSVLLFARTRLSLDAGLVVRANSVTSSELFHPSNGTDAKYSSTTNEQHPREQKQKTSK